MDTKLEIAEEENQSAHLSRMRAFFQYTLGHISFTIILALIAIMIPLYEPRKGFAKENYTFICGLGLILIIQAAYYHGAWGEEMMKTPPSKYFCAFVVTSYTIVMFGVHHFQQLIGGFPVPLMAPLAGCVYYSVQIAVDLLWMHKIYPSGLKHFKRYSTLELTN
jgi:hypothetical protein